MISGREEEPKLAVLLDNSISVSIKDAKGDRKEKYLKAIKESDFLSLDYDNILVNIFDNKPTAIEEFDEKNLKFDGQITNISNALKSVVKSSSQNNIQAVLLISDGVYNSGNNPLYDAELLGKPIFTIGIGDSIPPKDISIQSLITNDVVYIDNPVPVNVNIKTSGYNEGEIKLQLYDNDKKIAEQNFTVLPEKQDFTAVMEFSPQTDGVHKLTARLNNFENEITLKNNSKSEYVEVLKDKKKITIFAGAPTADISFIKNTLRDDKGVELKSFVQKNNNEYYEGFPQPQDFKDTELFILIGFPISTSSAKDIEAIKNELDKGKSIFFIASKNTHYAMLRPLEEFLPFNTTSSKPNEFQVIPDVNVNAIANPVMKITGTNKDLDLWNQLPPVFRTETFVSVKPESEILATMKINNVPLKEPLILARSLKNQKSVAVLGYDLYRWKMLGFAVDEAKGITDKPDIYSVFIRNTIKWLSVDSKNKLVSIKTTKQFYSQSEKVEFYAQVYDQSYTPIENASLNLTIKGSDGTNKELLMNTLGNGRYHGVLEGLVNGGYYFKGEAILNGKSLGSDNGRFSVGETELEYRELTMNTKLLRSISERTGGKFYTEENADQFLNDLNKLRNYKAKAITIRSEITLWNLPWLTFLAIILLGTEWFIRKRSGMV
jgi:hypothetical protein